MKGTRLNLEEAIRIEAYLLSEKAGHPAHLEKSFWVQAEAIVHGRIAVMEPTGKATVPKTKSSAAPKAGKPKTSEPKAVPKAKSSPAAVTVALPFSEEKPASAKKAAPESNFRAAKASKKATKK